MAEFLINGGQELKGIFPIRGYKNATTPILAATILVKGKVQLHNVPRILDVERVLRMLESMGASVEQDEHDVTIDTTEMSLSGLDKTAVKKMRSSSLMIAPLVRRFSTLDIPEPGGCNLGQRPFEPHILAFEKFGVHCEVTDDGYAFNAKEFQPVDLTMSELSPTGTENALLLAASIEGVSTIHHAASDVSVQDLCHFLVKCGVEIQGIGTHDLEIHGVKDFQSNIEYSIVPDTIETGSIICLAAANHSDLVLTHAASPRLMPIVFQKFEQMGIQMEIQEQDTGQWYSEAEIHIKPSDLVAISKVHTMPHPGFPSDLLPPFATLATQALGKTLIHEWMYEGRQKYLGELERMGANIEILDPHRAIITGKADLHGQTITSFDLRAGATLVIAALLAKGESRIRDIDMLDRGYEALDERLLAVGADIKRISN